MIHVLVVGPPALASLLAHRSSIEVLHAESADEAVEKLGRNRRIDAVLLLSGADNGPVAMALREDIVAPPPLFAGGSSPDAEGVRRLEATDLEELLSLVEAALEAGR